MPGTAMVTGFQPGGVFTITEAGFTTGNVFYVGSTVTGATNGSGYGRSPSAPFATIDYAVGQCTANNGDIIYVMPGHAETVSAAAGLDFDVAGITVIGIGDGTATPTVTLDTITTADVDVDAANVTVKNIHFRVNFADVVAAIDVNATNATFTKCRFTSVATNMNALIWILGASSTTSNNLTVEDCYFLDKDAANTHAISLPGTSDQCVIRNNIMIGDWGTAAIGAAGNVTNIVVVGNLISNAASDNDACINIAAAGTGIVMNNLACGGAAQANGITATNCAIAQNFYGVVTEDLSAILDPIAT